MDKRKLEYFSKYKIGTNQYKGILNKDTLTEDYAKSVWVVDGTGRAISAMIQISNGGQIIKHRIWSYDSFFEWKRKRNHRKMMLEALQWATN